MLNPWETSYYLKKDKEQDFFKKVERYLNVFALFWRVPHEARKSAPRLPSGHNDDNDDDERWYICLIFHVRNTIETIDNLGRFFYMYNPVQIMWDWSTN